MSAVLMLHWPASTGQATDRTACCHSGNGTLDDDGALVDDVFVNGDVST